MYRRIERVENYPDVSDTVLFFDREIESWIVGHWTGHKWQVDWDGDQISPEDVSCWVELPLPVLE